MYSNQIGHRANETDNKLFLYKIVRALRDIENKSMKKLNENFCIEETLTPADIKVVVKGVGKLTFPLSTVYVQKLIHVSTTTKFEKGEQTTLNEIVHHKTIELKNLNVTINQEAWSRITNNIQKALNLPTNSTLTPHLLNMLIYGPGDFFTKQHHSKNLQNIVATLVIILPSPHIGGDFIVEYNRKKHIFSTENVDEENFKCICFYSDCLHKINKIKSGYRIALTFGVVLETNDLVQTARASKDLTVAMRDYFNTAIVKEKSNKIIFLLNHTYSEYSLGWSLLKDEDGRYASSLRAVARELDLDIHLVLAKVRKCGSLTSEYDSIVNCWIDTNNTKLPYGEYSTTRSEICFVQEIHGNFEQFPGPSGNERTTGDYQYKRAAIVLWRKSDSEVIKFKLNYDEAMTELTTLISVPGNEEKVKRIVGKAAELLYKDHPAMNHFETFVNIALYVKEKEKAQTILSAFCPNVLIPKNAQMLVKLQQQYGINWIIELLGTLQREKRYDYSSDSLMAPEAINPFVREFLYSGGDRSVMEFLLRTEVTSFIEKSAMWNTFFRFGKTKDREKPQELFKACMTIENASLQEKLAQHLTSQPKLYPRKDLVKLYLHLQRTLPPESSKNFEPLRALLREAVKQEWSSQDKYVDDWSISANLSCRCVHCNVLANFLHSKIDKSKTWSANGNICKHVVSKLKRLKAPVDVTVKREKKPFTMLLVKYIMQSEEAARKRTELKMMLQILEPSTNKRRSLMKNDDKKRQKL